MGKRGISRVEDMAQDIIEGTFGRLLGGRLESQDIANQLAREIEDNERSGPRNPTYEVALNPDDFRVLLLDNPNLTDDLTEIAQQLGASVGLNLSSGALVRLVIDPSLKQRRVRITAVHSENEVGSDQMTQARVTNPDRIKNLSVLEELDAFLIIQGRTHILLDRPLTSIGRRVENDIVLDIPSVSRRHAQIRWRFNNFIIYDTSNRGNTRVNGHLTQEHVLQAGDVIALGDALLIYGEGNDEMRPNREDKGDIDQTLTREA